ncbi:hypothetical protein [Ammoniphilus sp. YIM 78166]|uniref:hypothetical protein n=1 Tax=Ammoniphilus sp. YIM 78166 TaxID=1644106 RepID=UPI00106FB382|nr:hypothetical protein [Ammoniphilus sp. YIM 78166]
MQLARNLFFAIVLSTMLAFLLSSLPPNVEEQQLGLTPVFKSTKPMILREENLVDVLSAFETRLALGHVKWENRNLFIDYKASMEKPIYVEDIYDDLFSVIKFAYLNVNNVEGLYVRVLYKEKGRDEVLIAVSAEKTNHLLKALTETEDKKSFLQEFTTLTHGVLWKTNFQK